MNPNVILVKFNVNPKWQERLIGVDVPLRTPDDSALELKHMFHALSVGRNPFESREETADSGIRVFGKEGAQNVSINGLFGELCGYGYSPSKVHIRIRNDKKFNVLVIPFVKPDDENHNTVSVTGQRIMGLIRELLNVSWGYVHVWDNPPQANGQIVHTVNLSHRDVGKSPEKSLHFQKGEWSVR